MLKLFEMMIEIEPETPYKTHFFLKAVICVCVLANIAWVIYKVRMSRPGLSAAIPAGASGQNLAESQEVQDRLHQNISGLVENPSPFEEEDAKLRQQLDAQTTNQAQ
jgi:hypothetical protein